MTPCSGYDMRANYVLIHMCITYLCSKFVGDVTVSDTITHENTGSNEFTLTCISTGGPATTVTWTRDSVTVTEGTETVLVNLETAQYTHTLTGNTEHGLYTCTVNNSKPSVASASLNVQGIYMYFVSEMLFYNANVCTCIYTLLYSLYACQHNIMIFQPPHLLLI